MWINIIKMLKTTSLHLKKHKVITYSLLRYVHKTKTKSSEKPIKDEKVDKDVLEYLKKQNLGEEKIKMLPKSLLRKYKMPENIYLINDDSAKKIIKSVKCKFNRNNYIAEVNPGMGVLTRKLLENQKNDLYLYETSASFSKSGLIKDLENNYPNRLHYKIGDFYRIAKLAFQDKIDGGTRVNNLLGPIANRGDGKNITIFGAMATQHFINHLIMTILLFHNSSNLLGTPDMYIAMPSYMYKDLCVDAGGKEKRFRRTPALFQLLFDHEPLAELPRMDFLPWQFENEDPIEETMYLINIKQKKKLPCDPEYLPLLWYFFRVRIVARSIRVIPYLEQWIPGCGIWLITGQDPPDTNRSLSPGPSDAPLPHMTIFTQFGDLTLDQKLTVFKRFISWPEFEHCTFRSTMESDLPKVLIESTNTLKDTIIDQLEAETTDR